MIDEQPPAQHVSFWLCLVREYMRLIANGILVHGPLLGWALQSGDKFKQRVDNKLEHVMPHRINCDDTIYPWYQHGSDATEGIRKMMQTLGYWTCNDTGVAQGATMPPMNSRKNANLVTRALALRTESCLQPSGFKFDIVIRIF